MDPITGGVEIVNQASKFSEGTFIAVVAMVIMLILVVLVVKVVGTNTQAMHAQGPILERIFTSLNEHNSRTDVAVHEIKGVSPLLSNIDRKLDGVKRDTEQILNDTDPGRRAKRGGGL